MKDTIKTAIVLGASSGIGSALVKELVANGYKVGVGARRMHLLKMLKRELGGEIYCAHINMCNRKDAIAKIFQLIKKLGGRLDLFVISSAVGYQNSSLEWNKEKETVLTNVYGFTAIASRMFLFFRDQGHGHLVAITSVAGTRGMRHAPAYGSSKSYQTAYLQALSHKSVKEKLNVSVSDIRPGFVRTAMAPDGNLFWMSSPQRAAKQIFYAIKRRKKTAYITKRWLLVAWFIRLLPRFIYERI